MPLKDIQEIVARDVGESDFASNPEGLASVNRLINQACEQIYNMTDFPGCLREVYIKVTANKRLALPPFIGEIRKVRDVSLGRPWTVMDMRPRYNYMRWVHEWDLWVFVGYSAFAQEILNAAPLVYTIEEADEDLTVTTVGSETTAARTKEDVVMSADSVEGVKNFIHIDSVALSKQPEHDVVVYDADGREISRVYNFMREARYVIVDVSKYPQIGECSDGTKIMEVLYKMPLRRLVNPDDVFVLPDYDTVIAYKAIQLHYEKQEGKEQRVIMMQGKINQLLNQILENKKSGIDNAVDFGPNKYISMLECHAPYLEYPVYDDIYPTRF